MIRDEVLKLLETAPKVENKRITQVDTRDTFFITPDRSGHYALKVSMANGHDPYYHKLLKEPDGLGFTRQNAIDLAVALLERVKEYDNQ